MLTSYNQNIDKNWLFLPKNWKKFEIKNYNSDKFDLKITILTHFDLIKPKHRQEIDFLNLKTENFDGKTQILTIFDLLKLEIRRNIDIFLLKTALVTSN